MHLNLCRSRSCRAAIRLMSIAASGVLVTQIVVAQQDDTRTFLIWPTVKDASTNFTTVQQLQHAVPRKAQKEMLRAEKARLAGRNEEAIGLYKATVSIDPDYVAARNNLALLYISKDEVRQGLEQLQEAVKIDPHNSLLFRNLSIGFALSRQLLDAERAARQAIDLNRSDLMVRMILGVVSIALS